MRTSVPALGVVLLLTLASCTLNTDYFSEYRGKNLLSKHDFGAAGVWQTTTYGIVSGFPTTDYYMLWENVGVAAHSEDGAGLANTPSVGPDLTSPVYRLEIINLIPDGDFEAETDGQITVPSASWTKVNYSANPIATSVEFNILHTDNNAPSPVAFPGTTLQTISHRSMLFSAQNGGDELALDLDAGVATTLGFAWRPGQYRLRFDLINGTNSQSFTSLLLDGAAAALNPADADLGGVWPLTTLNQIQDDPKSVFGESRSFTVSATTDQRLLVFGAKNPTQDAAILDNVRVFLANQEFSTQMSFTSLNSGPLTLLSGSKPGAYTFTVAVQDDKTADQDQPTYHVGNRFHPSGMTITIEGKAKNTPQLKVLAQKFFARPASGWTAWTTLSLDGGLDFVSSDADLEGLPALRVRLSPTNQITGGKDVGSLLVAQPTLTFNP